MIIGRTPSPRPTHGGTHARAPQGATRQGPRSASDMLPADIACCCPNPSESDLSFLGEVQSPKRMRDHALAELVEAISPRRLMRWATGHGSSSASQLENAAAAPSFEDEPAAPPPAWLVVGATVDYIDGTGLAQAATIKAVHTDDRDGLYCTVLVLDSGAERQTPVDRLRLRGSAAATPAIPSDAARVERWAAWDTACIYPHGMGHDNSGIFHDDALKAAKAYSPRMSRVGIGGMHEIRRSLRAAVRSSPLNEQQWLGQELARHYSTSDSSFTNSFVVGDHGDCSAAEFAIAGGFSLSVFERARADVTSGRVDKPKAPRKSLPISAQRSQMESWVRQERAKMKGRPEDGDVSTALRKILSPPRFFSHSCRREENFEPASFLLIPLVFPMISPWRRRP